MIKVSILMNGYNSEKYLKEAIDSIYAQSFQDWEIIFIDNCSTDNTKKIVYSYDDKIRYYKTDTNIPIGAARNFGLQYCKGEYLAFLDTDDIWIEDKLEKQIKILDNNKQFQFCYGGVIYIDENSNEFKKELPNAKSGNVFAQQLRRYEINQQAIMIRNNIQISINENLTHSPDFHMFMIMASKYDGYVINDFLVKYRIHSDNLTTKNIKVWGTEMQYTLDYIFNSNPELKERYSLDYKFAYAKVGYYKAQYAISIGEYTKAILELSEYKYLHITYFVLYISSFFPQTLWKFIHKIRT